ncbi:hypothetical protein KFK09_024222 [Dendrobium nobile]|uniref:Uncharacterized protein n=1 Tax=Dendrobium nobile TaxID=94219 RepID=A0A8T3ADE4_DENNO|nr:hypothetical protein KFK09_024222 [Dendrobium nobile]
MIMTVAVLPRVATVGSDDGGCGQLQQHVIDGVIKPVATVVAGGQRQQHWLTIVVVGGDHGAYL